MNKRIIYFLILIFTCIISSISQVILKKAAQKNYSNFIRQYLNIYVISAYILFFLVIIMNTYILKVLPLSVMNPIAETLPYILSIILGHIFFNEKINKKTICGIIFIIMGIGVLVI